jgi:hypothetical protein
MIDITKPIETVPTSWQAAIPCEYVGNGREGYHVQINGAHRLSPLKGFRNKGEVWYFTKSGRFQGGGECDIQIRNVIEEPVMTNRPTDVALLKAHQLLYPYTTQTIQDFVTGSNKFTDTEIAVAAELDRLGYTPPVDPLVIAAREICSEFGAPCSGSVEAFMDGLNDDAWEMQFVVAKLREIKGE